MNEIAQAIEKRATSTMRVLALMSDGQWHSNVQITLPQYGGNRGVGRLWEAERKWNLQIERRRDGVDKHSYRWVDHGKWIIRDGKVRQLTLI